MNKKEAWKVTVYTKAKKEMREIGTAEMLMQAFGACDRSIEFKGNNTYLSFTEKEQ